MTLDRATREQVKATLYHALETGESKELLQLLDERRIPSNTILEGTDFILAIAMKNSRNPEDPATKIALSLLEKSRFLVQPIRKIPCHDLSQLYSYLSKKSQLAINERNQATHSLYNHNIAYAYSQLRDKEKAHAHYKLVTTVSARIESINQIMNATGYINDLLKQDNQEEAIDWLVRVRQSDRTGFDEHKYNEKCDAIIPVAKSRWIFNKALGFLYTVSAVEEKVLPSKEASHKTLTSVEFLKHLQEQSAKSSYAKKTLTACSKTGSFEQRLIATVLSQQDLGAEFKHAEFKNFDIQHLSGLESLYNLSNLSVGPYRFTAAKNAFKTNAHNLIASLPSQQDPKPEIKEQELQYLSAAQPSLITTLKQSPVKYQERLAYAHLRWATSCFLLANAAETTHPNSDEINEMILIYHFILSTGLYNQLDHFARAEIKQHFIALLDTKHKEKALEQLSLQLYEEFKLEHSCSILLDELLGVLEKMLPFKLTMHLKK